MKLFWGLGKVVTLGLWLVVAVNQLTVLPGPFDVLIDLAGSLALVTHLLEIALFNGSLRGRAHPWFDRLQILIFGIFHLQSFYRSSAETAHA
jgi:putative membrane protein